MISSSRLRIGLRLRFHPPAERPSGKLWISRPGRFIDSCLAMVASDRGDGHSYRWSGLFLMRMSISKSFGLIAKLSFVQEWHNTASLSRIYAVSVQNQFRPAGVSA